MDKRTKLYCWGVIACAVAIIMAADWSVLRTIAPEYVAGAFALAAIGLISEMMSVMANIGRQQASSSIGFLPLFACLLLFPPQVAIAVALGMSVPTQLLIHKKPPLRAAFNVSQLVIAVFISALVFESLGGNYSVPLQFNVRSVYEIISFTGLAFTFFFVNQVLVSIAIAFSSGSKFTTVFDRLIAPSGANLLYDMMASPIALVVALLYSSFGIPGLAMVILPLLIIRHSYKTNLKLEQSNKDLLTVLVKTIETRDPYTSGHSVRVSILARAIAEDMDLSAAKIDKVEMTALVHDIGKVDAIYASIIRKQGPLTDPERHVILTHAAKGAEFLKTLTSFNPEIIDGVRHHHERYDGSGYPDGLTGEAIPLAARIIQLCDSIDAMLSDRPYRKALSVEHVRGELLRCAGTQFDPKIVDIILKRNTLERAAALVRPEASSKPQLVVASAS